MVARTLAASSGPLDIQGVDLLIAGVAGKDRRAVGRDVDLSESAIEHTMKVFQAGDGFYLPVGESDALNLWFRACGREIEILAIQRWHRVHDLAHNLWSQVGPFLGFQIEGRKACVLLVSGYQSILVNPESTDAYGGRYGGFLPGAHIGN